MVLTELWTSNDRISSCLRVRDLQYCGILFYPEFHAISNGHIHFFRIRLLKNVNFLPIGLFHFISIQGVEELFQGVFREKFPGAPRKIFGYFQGVLLKLFFIQELRRPRIVHLYFFFPEGRIIILVIFQGVEHNFWMSKGQKKIFPGVGMLFRNFQGVKEWF